MTLTIDIAGGAEFELEHLLLDLNGTLTERGELLDGVPQRLRRLSADLHLHLLSADTFGTADQVAAGLQLPLERISAGEEKLRYLDNLGADKCAAIGNGSNDAAMLEAAVVGIAVIGPEAASAAALRAADVIARSIEEALELLIDPRTLAATLRA